MSGKMSQPAAAWHGLAHGKAWCDFGKSYADLAGDRQPVNCSQQLAPGLAPAAGTSSSRQTRGAGTFQLQASQSAKGKISNFPKETYPTDFRTTKQQDFAAERLMQATGPAKPIRPAESGTASLIRPDQLLPFPQPKCMASAPSIQTKHIRVIDCHHEPKARPGEVLLRSAAPPEAIGQTRKVDDISQPAFNIITGHQLMQADRAKYWNGQQMDYRRRR